MPVLTPAEANRFDLLRVQNCLLEFSVKAHYNSPSFCIYMFSNNVNRNKNTTMGVFYQSQARQSALLYKYHTV